MYLRYSIENDRLLFKRCKPSTFHLQSERQLLNLIHAFDGIHYNRYNTNHHILLSDHKRRNTNGYQELRNSGFTTSIKDGRFNYVHGDYICERQNGEIKGSGGPINGFLSNSTTTFNTWSPWRSG